MTNAVKSPTDSGAALGCSSANQMMTASATGYTVATQPVTVSSATITAGNA